MLERHFLFNSADLQSGWFWILLAVVVGAVGLIVVLMRYERTLVPRKVGYTLLGLRIAVLGVLLLTLLEPIIAWTRDRQRNGRILIAVDVSESMTTADNHATKAEKLRWARALGMIGNASIDARLDRWIEAYENGEEPQWVDPDETQNAARRQELAQSRRENVEELFDEIDQIPRKELVHRLITSGAYPLLPALQDIAAVEIVLFSGEGKFTDESQLEEEIENPPLTLRSGQSNLSQGMTTAVSGGSNEMVVLGIVMFTDGRNNVTTDPVRTAGQLGYAEVPIYPVIIGSEFRPKDLAVANVEYPQTALKDDKPVLTATLKTSGFEGEEITVVLEKEGEEPEERKIMVTGAITSADFDLDAETIGRQKYTLRMDVQEGETRDDNNSKSFAMNVVDDKVRILVLDGEARWEFRYLETALGRDDKVELKMVVFDQPYMGLLRDTFFPRILELPADPGDIENSPFADPQMVVIGDVSPADLPEKAWLVLEKFVSESGGTLVFTAGKRYMPLAFNSPTLDNLLPITNLEPINITGVRALGPPRERGFHLQLTPEGQNEVMLQFSSDPIKNLSIWSMLPGHMWGLLGETKPGATVYAQAVGTGGDNQLEHERRTGVIVHQHYGAGQVLWIGVDSTWRWRHRTGDEYHHKFWGQMGRWAVENKAMAGNDFVKLIIPRTDIETGEDAIIEARWVRQFLDRNKNLKAKIEIYSLDKPEKPYSVLELKPTDDRPLVHTARAVSLPTGDYRVKLVAEGAQIKQDDEDDIEAYLYVKDRQTLELLDLSSNRKLLTQIADGSKGQLFDPDQVAFIPEKFRDPLDDGKKQEEITLWDHWFIMLVFFGLLTSEWVIRKLNGLP